MASYDRDRLRLVESRPRAEECRLGLSFTKWESVMQQLIHAPVRTRGVGSCSVLPSQVFDGIARSIQEEASASGQVRGKAVSEVGGLLRAEMYG